MSRFSEQTFDNWSKPASESEEQRISNAIKMVKDAINSSDELYDKDIDIFVQGSYANNTNVKTDSDIDICIMFKDTFNAKYPDSLTRDDYGFTASNYRFLTYRKTIINVLQRKFITDLKQGNKSIKISSNSYRVDADVVPCFQYRNYRYENSRNPDIFVEGIKFDSQDGQEVISYPKQHIENGKTKNTDTQRRFKRAVRIFKKIRYYMVENNKSIDSGISSFLIECLLWNVPDRIFNNYASHTSRIKEVIRYLYLQTKDHKKECQKWGEVSGMVYLFHNGKKWDIDMVNNFLLQVWNYLELED